MFVSLYCTVKKLDIRRSNPNKIVKPEVMMILLLLHYF